MKIKNLIVLILIGLAACSNDDEPINQPEGEPFITAQIGEDEWEAADFESAVNVIPEKGQYFELNASNEDYTIDLSVLEFGTATGTITEKIYEGSDEMFLSLFLADEEGDLVVEYRPLQAADDEEAPVSINVTAATNNRISGTFSGIVHKVVQGEEEDYPEFLLIGNGVFNNLPFETQTVNIQ